MAAEQNSTECQQILAHIQFGDAPYIVRVVDNNNIYMYDLQWMIIMLATYNYTCTLGRSFPSPVLCTFKTSLLQVCTGCHAVTD